ncbi:unnamed protein product, partial [Staurois parvus]
MTSAIPSDYVCSDSHPVPDLGLNRLPSTHLNPGRACIPRTGASCLQTYLRAPAVLLSGLPTSTPTGVLCNSGPDSRCPTLRGVRNLAAREALSPLASITRWTPIKLWKHLKDDHGNRMHQRSIVSVMAKAGNTYVYVFFFFNKLQRFQNK